jgi:hypothetical protein
MWTYVIAGFYLFCVMDVALLLWFMHLLARSEFRSEEEGSTVQVGYEEDPQGEVIPTELSAAGHNEEHVGAESILHSPGH